MNTIVTFEHSYLTPAQFANPQDFAWLIEQNFAVFQIERKQHQWQLKVRHYIGVIGLPSGYHLEILPKINKDSHNDIVQTRQWVQQMLKDVWQALLPKHIPNLASQMPINNQLPLNQWLQLQFWQGFQQYQPNQQYQRFEQNHSYLQGKLLIKEQLQYNQHQPYKFYHQIENFAFDTACNRLVKTAIERVIGGAHFLLSQEWQSVQTIATTLYDVTLSQALQELTALPTALAQYNRQFIGFCYALLTLQQASGQGDCQTPTLLINMQYAFEKWVGIKLQAQFIPLGFNLFEQKLQPLTADNSLFIKPDILLKSENKTIVADVKWKNIHSVNSISLADMYQLITYASELDADEAWLIVPTMYSDMTGQLIKFTKPKKASFYLVTFDVIQAKFTGYH